MLCFGAILASLPSTAAEPPRPRIAPAYEEWLDGVRPFASSAEVEVFEGLSSDIEREHFIDAFWQRRGEGGRERFAANGEAAAESRHRSRAMDRVVLMAGKPEKKRTFYECGPTLRRFSLWEYSAWQVEHQTGTPAGGGASVVFYQEIRDDPRSFGVWTPDTGEDLEALGGEAWEQALATALEAAERQGCLDKARPDRLVKAFREGLSLEALAGTFGWPTAAAPLPEAYDDRRFGVGRLETDYPGNFFQRTILRGQVRLPVGDLASPGGAFVFDRITVQGDLYRGLRLIDGFTFTYHLAGTRPSSGEVTLDFYRRLFPSPYDLEVRVLDGRGRVLLRENRALRVPKMAEPAPFPAGRRGDFNQLTRSEVVSLVTFPSVRLLPPSSEHVPGSLRLQAVTGGGPIAAVEFFVEDRSVGRDEAPPYLAEAQLGEGPAKIRVVALDPEGRPLADDQRLVLTRSHGFLVAFEETSRNGSEGRPLPVRIVLPAGEELAAVECWLDDRRIAVPDGPPYLCPTAAPGIPAPTFARVVGRLASGPETEDVVFLTATPAEEVDVQVAELYVSVVDRQGRPVTGLGAEEFKILEGGEERAIVSAEGIRDLPIHVAVLMDTSSSMGTRVRTASASAQRFFESLLTARDRASLISFNHDLYRRVPFTNDVEVLRYGALGARAYGATRLWDAVTYSLSSFAGLPDRRALVALTDGADTDSDFPFEQVLDTALRARVMIFPVTLARLDEETSAQLQELAQETGGVAFRAEDMADLDRVYRRIEELLRSQYLIVYRPEAAPAGGRLAAPGSPIEVRLGRPELVAHSVRRKL